MWDTPGYAEKRLRNIKLCLDDLREIAGIIPDLRFTQLLAILDIKPDEQWHEEPWVTHEKLVKWKDAHIKSNIVEED